MRNKFISTLRLLAELARQPVSSDIRTGVERSYALRETINSNFDQVRAQADAVIFEFGPSRGRDMEFREGVRRWQPQLRTLFLLRIAALKYELQTPGFEVPETVRLRQHDYDELSARMLEQLADRIANREPGMTQRTGDLGVSIMEALRTVETEASRELPSAKAHSLITLLRAINDLTTRLAQEMVAELTGL